MIPAGRVTAVVLAAGASSRFGGQKLLAPFRRRPLLQSVLDTVAEVGFGEVVVVLGHDADRIEPAIEWRDARIVRNPDPDRGLSSSLKVGLAAVVEGSDAALILLGDQPLVPREVIERLLGAYDPGGRPVVVPRYTHGVRGNPVLVARDAFDLADEASGDRGLAPVLSRHPDVVVEVSAGASHPDVDTPEDMAALDPPAGQLPGGRMSDARKAETEAASIGGTLRHDGPIRLAAYDPTWPSLFEREASRVRGALGDLIVLLEHVGSTSVPGLSAKPIIDILLAVPDSSDEPAYVPPLEAAGYRLVIPEPGWHEHRVFKGPDTNVNLHVFSPGTTEISRMLAFRDRLRADAGERELYESKKRELAARHWDYVQGYADAKGDVVEAIIGRALAKDG